MRTEAVEILHMSSRRYNVRSKKSENIRNNFKIINSSLRLEKCLLETDCKDERKL